MPYPDKPWYHGQTHEIINGKQFQYDSDSHIWTRIESGSSSSGTADSEALDMVRDEIDSDLLLYVTKKDHDSDIANLFADFGTY